MLVLTRKAEQTIVFPDLGITVAVCRIEGDRVRLGIEAEGVRVFRGELMDRVDPWIIQEKPKHDSPK